MTPQVISLSSLGSTAWIPVDYKQNPFNISATVVLSNTPNLTYTVQYTTDNVFNSSITPTVFSSSLVGATSDGIASLVVPVRAVRLNISVYVSGTATLTLLQGANNSNNTTLDIASITNTAPNKTAVVYGDYFPILDSENSYILKKCKLSDLGLGTVWNVALLTGLPTKGFLNIQRQTDGPNIYLDCISNTVTNGHSVYNMRRANGTPAALTAVQSGDEYGAIACRVHNGTDWEDHSGSLSWGATENHTLTANGSGFSLYTILNGTVGSWQAFGVDGTGKSSIYGGLSVAGGSASSVDLGSVVPSSQVTSFNGVNIQLYTQSASFTLADMFLLRIRNTTLQGASAINRQIGLRIEDLTSGASNYGFRCLLSSGASKWNLFIDGTAKNYILGDTGIGVNAPSAKVHALATTEQLRLGYDTSNRASFTVDATGILTITTAGTAPALLLSGDVRFDKTVTAAGTTGARTINKTTGSVNFAAAATSLVVTNSLVSVNSIIICTVGTNDTTMKSVTAVAASGSFTIYANAAATAETRVNFQVFN